MPYTITILLKFKEVTKINSIRKKYDPFYKQIKPHLTLVYYFDKKPSTESINNLIKNVSSFKVRLNKIRASSKDNYVFLDVTEGKEKLILLKKVLYRRLGLKWKEKFLYKPHITLANLKTKSEQKQTLKEIKKDNLDFYCKIDSFSLLNISKDLITLKSKREFNLA